MVECFKFIRKCNVDLCLLSDFLFALFAFEEIEYMNNCLEVCTKKKWGRGEQLDEEGKKEYW